MVYWKPSKCFQLYEYLLYLYIITTIICTYFVLLLYTNLYRYQFLLCYWKNFEYNKDWGYSVTLAWGPSVMCKNGRRWWGGDSQQPTMSKWHRITFTRFLIFSKSILAPNKAFTYWRPCMYLYVAIFFVTGTRAYFVLLIGTKTAYATISKEILLKLLTGCYPKENVFSFE